MSITTSDERRARAAEEAAGWMLRLESGQLSTVERGQFIDWLRESPLHVAEMLRVGAVHGLLTEFTGWNDIASVDALPSDNVVPLPVRGGLSDTVLPVSGHGRFKQIGLLAASLAVIAVSAFWMLGRDVTHIQTQRGEHREIKLVDGSLLEMAPDSEVHLHIDRKQRLVILDRGEALFHVAKDPDRPFIVEADQTRVRAVGTAFSVARNADAILVTVAEGKVTVSMTEQASQRTTRNPAMRSIALGINQQVAVTPSGVATDVRTVDSRMEMAWARGVLIFDGNTVAEVVRRFNLANRVQIRVLDQTLAARPVSGVFDAADPQSFVAFLATAPGVKIVKNAPEEIVIAVNADAT